MVARICVFLLAASLCLVACDSGNEQVLPIYGSLTVTVTSSAGDSSAFSGNAFARFDGDLLVSMTFGETDEAGRLGSRAVFLFPAERRALRPGVYTVGGLFDSTAAFTAHFTNLTSLDRLSTDAGELTVESVDETEVRGRFQFEATTRPFEPDGQTRYSVRGSFEALVTRDPNGGR